MPAGTLADPLLDGRQALEAARRHDARASFEQALAAQDTPHAARGELGSG